MKRALRDLSKAQHDLEQARAALQEARSRYAFARSSASQAQAVWSRFQGNLAGAQPLNHGFVSLGIGALIWLLVDTFYSPVLCDLRILALAIVAMGVASLCLGYYGLAVGQRRHSGGSPPWWQQDEPDGASVPRALLAELARDLGPARVAELLKDRQALKSALLAVHEKWRQRLLDEEGLSE